MKKGFTLSEVLITLGIIGVVAAITIPMLITNIQKQKVETSIRAFQSKISHALKLAVVDYGDISGWAFDSEIFGKIPGVADYETNKKFVEKYILPYMKVGTSPIAVKANSDVNYPNGVKIKMFDGSAFVFTYQLFQNSTGKEPLLMIRLFINGNETDRSAKNMFAFMMSEEHALKPFDLNWDGKKATLLNHSTWGCKAGFYMGKKNGLYCTKLIQLNNWKIPPDYPWKN